MVRSRDDLLVARETIRTLLREFGYDAVQEIKLIAGLSDLTERFFPDGQVQLTVQRSSGCLEVMLEKSFDQKAESTFFSLLQSKGDVAALGGVRFMWDQVEVCSAHGPSQKVILRSWLK
ncbi:MAG: hypothetical protein HY692_03165 [Cyanobacteria bacterium NC_groundwater_1444_Ag_S-0.65um_54_12]|nr:hypothetical protein [Cyanobacteria bacterium NC_groundwater_1444_Ag_S-0.65um_54_12]